MRPNRPHHFSARLRCDAAVLQGSLAVPADASGLVILSYPQPLTGRAINDRPLLSRLHENGLGTFSIGLLDENEPAIEAFHRLDLAMLASRVRAACDWVRGHVGGARLPLGFFSTGLACAATFLAAAEQPADAAALVARAGRPDLAGPALRFVAAPTLFIVGSEAETMLSANQLAFEQLPGTKSVEIILGGGADLAEPEVGTLVATSAAGWLAAHLCPAEVS